ncbi:MAG: hypothetical protein M1426_05850, partial [Patescibacteria group bacterium]|nr:hypothetical protein [Patescibacteria group bacterium]
MKKVIMFLVLAQFIMGLVIVPNIHSQNVIEKALSGTERIKVSFFKDDVFRIQIIPEGKYKDTGLNRYGF